MSATGAPLSGRPQLDLPEFDEPPGDPLSLAAQWVRRAADEGLPDPWAATLATVDANGQPSTRVLTIKALTRVGALFGTASSSRKGTELARNPRAALTFFWPQRIQQLHLYGVVSAADPEVSDRLWATRPAAARAATTASKQSARLQDEALLHERATHLGRGDLARPDDWQAYLLTPTEVEFWCGSPDRLHRRLGYRRSGVDELWTVLRLQP